MTEWSDTENQEGNARSSFGLSESKTSQTGVCTFGSLIMNHCPCGLQAQWEPSEPNTTKTAINETSNLPKVHNHWDPFTYMWVWQLHLMHHSENGGPRVWTVLIHCWTSPWSFSSHLQFLPVQQKPWESW